jgi:hypothetical protein
MLLYPELHAGITPPPAKQSSILGVMRLFSLRILAAASRITFSWIHTFLTSSSSSSRFDSVEGFLRIEESIAALHAVSGLRVHHIVHLHFLEVVPAKSYM